MAGPFLVIIFVPGVFTFGALGKGCRSLVLICHMYVIPCCRSVSGCELGRGRKKGVGIRGGRYDMCRKRGI